MTHATATDTATAATESTMAAGGVHTAAPGLSVRDTAMHSFKHLEPGLQVWMLQQLASHVLAELRCLFCTYALVRTVSVLVVADAGGADAWGDGR